MPPKNESVLRVAALRGTDVLAKAELKPGESLSVGTRRGDLVSRPEGAPVPDRPLSATRAGWEVSLEGTSGGCIEINRKAIDPTASTTRTFSLNVGDQGVLKYGLFVLCFQCAGGLPHSSLRRARRRARRSSAWIGAALMLAALGFTYALATPGGIVEPLERVLPRELLARLPLRSDPLTEPSARPAPSSPAAKSLAELWTGARAEETRSALASIGVDPASASNDSPLAPGSDGSARPAAAPSAVGSPSSSDGLSPAEIRRGVMSQYAVFRQCYEPGWGVPRKQEVTVTVSWSITPGGRVTGATIASASPRDARIENCVLLQLGQLRFPTADQATHSSFTFTFRPNGQ